MLKFSYSERLQRLSFVAKNESQTYSQFDVVFNNAGKMGYF